MITLWPLLLPVAAASGWIWARRQKPQEQNKPSLPLARDYFVGLNYLLNEQHDKAIDIFLKLLTVDSDTVEMHLALGSLFRRRGEVDRAIRIHQNLIARPQLTSKQRIEALMALGQDYMRAGVLDRAERVFDEIVSLGTDQSLASMRCLMDIYQQQKSWQDAIRMAQQIALASQQPMGQIIAHYYCELCQQSLTDGQVDAAKRFFKKALASDSQSARAHLLQGKIEAQNGNYKAAIKAYKRVQQRTPHLLTEAVQPLAQCYRKLQTEDDFIVYLQKILQQTPRMSIALVLGDFIYQRQGAEQAIDFVGRFLGEHPSLRGLHRLIHWHLENSYGKVREKLLVLQTITERLLADKPNYRCGSCGFPAKSLYWMCPGCKKWDTVQPIKGLEGD